MKRFNQLFTILLVPLDYLMLVASFAGAYWLRVNWQFREVIYIEPFPAFFKFACLVSLIWIAVFFIFGLYRFRGFKNNWELIGRLVTATSVALALFIIGLFLTKTGFFSRLIIVYFWTLSVVLVMVGRSLLNLFKQWLQYYGTGVEKVLLVAKGKIAETLLAHIRACRPSQKMVGMLDVINLDNFPVREVDRIVLGYELPREDMLRLIRFCEDKGVVLQYIPSLTGLYTSQMTIDTVVGYPLIELSPTPLAGWGRIIKRSFDLGLGTVGLILASPIMLVVAIAIKLNSKGPVIFAQKRVGELGKLFTFYKFRSMYAEMSVGEEYGGKRAEELLKKLKNESNEASGPLFKMRDDPRITKVGRFIRRTSLDELPQLFNVLLGSMSLVGPRPALPEEVQEYSDVARRRLLIKPGATGLWQTSGRSDASFDEYVKLDTYYIEHWSLLLDVKIILLTIKAVLGRRGSY